MNTQNFLLSIWISILNIIFCIYKFWVSQKTHWAFPLETLGFSPGRNFLGMSNDSSPQASKSCLKTILTPLPIYINMLTFYQTHYKYFKLLPWNSILSVVPFSESLLLLPPIAVTVSKSDDAIVNDITFPFKTFLCSSFESSPSL